MQSISCNVCLLSVCLFVPSWKPHFLMDWILLVEERISLILAKGRPKREGEKEVIIPPLTPPPLYFDILWLFFCTYVLIMGLFATS